MRRRDLWAVAAILHHEIQPVIVGQDPAFPKRIRAHLWRALEYQGVQGVTQFAMSVVDIAVWDILGKAAGLPVYKMLKVGRYPLERAGQMTLLFRRPRGGRQLGLPAQGVVQVGAGPVEFPLPRRQRVAGISLHHIAHGQPERMKIVLDA